VDHLLDRGPLEQAGEKIIPEIVAMKVEVHVLVDGREFVTDRLVQKLDTLLVHCSLLVDVGVCRNLTRSIVTGSLRIPA
jgi:hypothetical protein